MWRTLGFLVLALILWRASLLPTVAVGDATQQADDRLRALNDGMRANYVRTLNQVSANIDPGVVQFDGKGGTLTGVRPVPVNYELAKDYKDYAARIFEAVGRLRAYATDVQMRAIVAQLETWREELGPNRWYELSAVIIAPFTLSGDNAVAQALRGVMYPDQVNRRLINVGGDCGNDIDVAVNVMDRLFINGVAARLVFNQESELGQEMTRLLSTSRDLMAVPIGDVLHIIIDEMEDDDSD